MSTDLWPTGRKTTASITTAQPLGSENLFANACLLSDSRKLNNLFSFSVLCVLCPVHFEQFNSPANEKMLGRSYHQLRDKTEQEHFMRWLLYKSHARYVQVGGLGISFYMLDNVNKAPHHVNPYIGTAFVLNCSYTYVLNLPRSALDSTGLICLHLICSRTARPARGQPPNSCHRTWTKYCWRRAKVSHYQMNWWRRQQIHQHSVQTVWTLTVSSAVLSWY